MADSGKESLKIPLDGLEVPIHFMDGTTLQVKLKPDSTVGMLNVVLRDHLGITKDRDFGLYAYKSGEFKYLSDSDRFAQVFTRWQVSDLQNDTRRLYYRCSLYVPQNDAEKEFDKGAKAESPAYHQLTFSDAVHWFLVGHSRFPRGEACSLAALLWYVFRGKPGTGGASKEHMEEAIEYLLPAYTIIREAAGSQAGASAPTSKSAADSPWSVSNATKDAPHPMSGKIPHMRMHVASDAAALPQLLEAVWTKYAAMSWSDKNAAEVEFIEQSKEYIPFGSDFFMARHTWKDRDGKDSDTVVRQRSSEVLVSVGHEGIHLVALKDPLSLQTHEYGQITKWTVSRDGNVFAYSLEDAAIVYLVSALAPAIESAVERYVVALLAKQKGEAEKHRTALSAADKQRAPVITGAGPRKYHHFTTEGIAAIKPAGEDAEEEVAADDEEDAPELPAGWQQVGPDEEGDIYYVNNITGASKWEVPTEEDATHLLPGWERVEDDEGDVFYVNEESGESSWDAPLAEGSTAQDAVAAMEAEGGEEDDEEPLPDGWEKVGPDEDGDVYYVNEELGTSSWDRPTE